MKRGLSFLATTAFILSVALVGGVKPVWAESELLMFEEQGCGYCEAWKEQVGPIYPKTVESKRLPLRMVNIFDGPPKDIEFKAAVQFSPTFVVVEDGKEVGRIIGYQGDEFFWWYLDVLYKKLKPLDGRAPEKAEAESIDDRPNEG